MIKIVLFFLFIGFYFQHFAQQNERRASFGIHFKPLFEGGFIGSSKLDIKNEKFNSVINQKFGTSFGAIIRFPIWKNLYIETGLAQIKRNYQVDYTTLDSNFNASKAISFVSHDIPINALIFVKLSENFYLNSALGVSLVHNPSNVASQVVYNNYIQYKTEGRKRSDFAFEFNVTSGIEYRNTKFGGFYLGASARIPFRPIFDVATSYVNNKSNNKEVLYGSLNGLYVALDFRYFLPKTKSSKIQFEKGPLED